MVKPPVFPACRAVAGLTLDAQPTSMVVILSMTGDTCNARILECLLSVTLLAFKIRVLSQ